jgi:hypothetical protein
MTVYQYFHEKLIANEKYEAQKAELEKINTNTNNE